MTATWPRGGVLRTPLRHGLPFTIAHPHAEFQDNWSRVFGATVVNACEEEQQQPEEQQPISLVV